MILELSNSSTVIQFPNSTNQLNTVQTFTSSFFLQLRKWMPCKYFMHINFYSAAAEENFRIFSVTFIKAWNFFIIFRELYIARCDTAMDIGKSQSNRRHILKMVLKMRDWFWVTFIPDVHTQFMQCLKLKRSQHHGVFNLSPPTI